MWHITSKYEESVTRELLLECHSLIFICKIPSLQHLGNGLLVNDTNSLPYGFLKGVAEVSRLEAYNIYNLKYEKSTSIFQNAYIICIYFVLSLFISY